ASVSCLVVRTSATPPFLSGRPRRPPRSSLFPYTTLFRSLAASVWVEQTVTTRLPSVNAEDLRTAWADILRRARLVQHHRVTREEDRKSTRLNSSHVKISYAVFCLKKKKNESGVQRTDITP